MSHAARSAKGEVWGESILPWIYFLRGEPVIETLASLERSQWCSRAELNALQDKKLESLLAHCARNVTFYRERFERAGVRVGGDSPREVLARLPILERADVRELTAQVRRRLPRDVGVRTRRTAGTGGEPAIVYADTDANAHMLAARLRCGSWLGLQPGDKEARFWGRAWSGRARVGEWVKDRLLNRYRINPGDLHPGAIDASVRRFLRERPDYLYGYASMILEFADHLTAKNSERRTHLKAAILTAEATRQAERDRLARLLGCPVADEYGCSELDIIAHQCEEGSYHVIAENVFLEIIAADTSPPGRGEVVVTDLNNRLMPLLRYRLGDIAIPSVSDCCCGRGLPCLEGFAGRSKDQYMTFENGWRLHSYHFDYMFDNLMENGIDLKQVQVVQESERAILLSFVLERDSAEARDEIRRRIASAIVPTVGPGVVVRERFVDRIEIPSGRKYEFFIPRPWA